MRRPRTSPRRARLRAELEGIRESEGKVTASNVVEYARNHPRSQLHTQFTWDDGDAAEKWRLSEARHVIRVVLESGGDAAQPLRVHAYYSPPSYRNGDNGYVTASEVLTKPEIAREIALAAMKRIESAYEDLQVARNALPVLAKAARTCGRLIAELRAVTDPKPEPAPSPRVVVSSRRRTIEREARP